MTTEHTQPELAAMVHEAMNATRAVMVGIADGGAASLSHPMKAHMAQGESDVWFICRRDVSLAQEVIGRPRTAIVNLVSEDHHLHASMVGQIDAEREQGRIDQFWSSVADAWLPEGRLSPDVILLRFEPSEAQVWLSDNSFKLAWEVAKANLNRAPITSGETSHIKM